MPESHKPSRVLMDMFMDASPRILVVASLIGLVGGIKSASLFVCGVFVLYAWKVFKWHNRRMKE